ncbi:hypothetical protein Tco_0869375, partial [Tanacetum coccineum]
IYHNGDDDNDDGDDDDDKNDNDKADSERTESGNNENPEITQSTTAQEDEEEDDSERVHTPLEFVPTYDEENMDEDEDDEVTKELYKDVNINLGNEDAKMTNADHGGEEQHNVSQDSGFQQEEEDAHVTLTAVHDTQKTTGLEQSSFVSSDFTSKLLNLDSTPPRLDETSSQTSSQFTVLVTAIPKIMSATTVPPPPSSFNPLPQQTTPTLTPTTSEATTTFPALPDFSSMFKFNEQFELTKILMDKMEENKSYQVADYKKELYDALVETRRIKIKTPPLDQTEGQKEGRQARKSAHVEEPSHTIDDSGAQQDQEFIIGHTDEQPDDEAAPMIDWFKKPDRSPTPDPEWSRRKRVDFRPPQTWISKVAHAEEPPTSFDELTDTQFDFSAFVMNRLNINNLTQEILTSTKDVYSRRRIIAATRLKIMKMYDYGHLDEIEVRRDDQQMYVLKEDERYDLNVALRMYTRRIVIQRRVEDLQLGVESYQKKLNLTKPDTFRSGLRKRTAYTAYSDPQGVIYVDQNSINGLMRSDELHKFSDGTLTDVQTALQDISLGLRIYYMPKKKWSNLEKRRARVMIQDINRQLFQRRLMRNLEKFVSGREYEEDIRLLERTADPYGFEVKMDVERRSVKVKELQERCIIKAFKLKNQEKYEHVGPKSQDQKMARLEDGVKRLCLVDDLKKFKIIFMSSQRYKSNPKVKDHYIIFTR